MAGDQAERIRELEEALGNVRADARAARDEVVRLAAEGDALRTRLDDKSAALAPASETSDRAHDWQAEIDRVRAQAERAAQTWRVQVHDAESAAARHRAEAHKLAAEIASQRAHHDREHHAVEPAAHSHEPAAPHARGTAAPAGRAPSHEPDATDAAKPASPGASDDESTAT